MRIVPPASTPVFPSRLPGSVSRAMRTKVAHACLPDALGWKVCAEVSGRASPEPLCAHLALNSTRAPHGFSRQQAFWRAGVDTGLTCGPRPSQVITRTCTPRVRLRSNRLGDEAGARTCGGSTSRAGCVRRCSPYLLAIGSRRRAARLRLLSENVSDYQTGPKSGCFLAIPKCCRAIRRPNRIRSHRCRATLRDSAAGAGSALGAVPLAHLPYVTEQARQLRLRPSVPPGGCRL